MAIDLYDGEVEIRRVKEADIGWVTEQVVSNGEIVEIPRRDHPLEDGQRWVFDPRTDEWVLCGPHGKK